MSWSKEELEQKIREQADDKLLSIGRRRDYIKQLNKTIKELSELRDSIQSTIDKYDIQERF